MKTILQTDSIIKKPVNKLMLSIILMFTLTLAVQFTYIKTCDAYFYWFTSKSSEKSTGDQYANKIESENKVITGHQYNKIVDEITDKLNGTLEFPRYDYKVKVLDDGNLNAYSVPGGHIYITVKLLQRVKTYDQVAFVIAHELGHDMNEHWMKSVEKMYRTELAIALIGKAAKVDSSKMNWLYVAGYVMVSRGYGFDKEHESDKYGFDQMAAAGYNVGAGAMFFHDLMKLENRNGSTDVWTALGNYLNPHPKTDVRLQKQLDYMKAWSGNKVEVRDSSIYVNNKFMMTPSKRDKYSAHERAYYIAGNIAREYHDNNAVRWWISDDNKLMANETVIMSQVNGDDSPDIILNRITN